MIDSLINEMTLEEKVGQLTLFTSDIDITGPSMREGYKEDIQAGRVGAIFNAYGAAFTRQLQQLAVEETRLGIPLLLGYDVIHGFKTIFPIPLAEAASWDLAAMEKSARIAATEASAEGLHWTYAPMIDVARDPRWGRIAEGAGEDTYLGTQVALARIKGFQGDDLSAVNTILACAKHYAAYGASQAGRDYNTVDISELELRDTYLPPFKAAVNASVATFMTSFNEIFGVPASGSEFLLSDILRDEWNFEGFVVSDYTSINEMVAHGVVADLKDAGQMAITAGVDMDMQGAVYYEYLPDLVKEGKVDVATVNQSVRRILEAKYRLGLFDNPYRYIDQQREQNEVMTNEHLEAARDIARKSIVLLKNENDILPLKNEGQTIALIGPLADDKKELIGSWSAAGDWEKSVSLLEGLQQSGRNQHEILYAKGTNINDDSTQYFQEAIKTAERADVVILALGEAALMSGEAASRSTIDLPGNQLDLAKEIHKLGKPTIVVLMNGRPLTISWLDENVDSILETWFLGHQAGPAIADVIFGDYNPSGKLPVTFPRNVGQIPLYYNQKMTGRPLAENKYTSKYLDVPNTPLYPFGYGLSYTDFTYSDLRLSSKVLLQQDSIKLSIKLQNSGNLAGHEVVQLYIRDLVGNVTRPVKELKAFKKIYLEAGQTQEVTFYIKQEDLAFYQRDLSYDAEAGQFKVFIGGNSIDLLEENFALNY
ncbi:beta-glucosidase BglX [Catalinimonas alkaloidigena]|uniref:beta-glucosidase BglX n=1 Tax=Catalinimonas alkaloidigena TaxID=1075417 RepID=UPI0024075779|nr:beta-glucosidase BglX [Catalinimonas alkaloidigena]